jgi:hypothetical protein
MVLQDRDAAGTHARVQFVPEDHSDHLVALYLLPSPVSGALPLEWASCLLQQPQCSDAVTLRGTGHVDDLDLVDICHACRTTPAEDLRIVKMLEIQVAKSRHAPRGHLGCG